MKISCNWIREFVAVDATAAEIADALTMGGIEIEGLEHDTVVADIVVARIDKVIPHPNADKLRLCTVDAGGREPLKVVCGAPNAREGLLSAFAPVGVELGEGFKVKKTKIRGEESFGILLSEKEIGLTDDHSGIMELPEGLTPGQALVEALDLEDWILEVNVTPNRGDCLSAVGLAREIAAIYRSELKLPEGRIAEAEKKIADLLKVEIEDRTGCPRYAARMLEDVKIGPSPFWMRRRLFQSEVRAINNVVDITNYLLLEYGQPMHAFDYSMITDGVIRVRKAESGEKFTTLDSIERDLVEDDLMICDAKRSIALAGVMGGENTEVQNDTNCVVLESAFFDPVTIRKTSKRLGLSTEAAYRFERGIDPCMQLAAADRAAYLMSELAGAVVLKGSVDENFYQAATSTVPLRHEYMERVLGISVREEDVVDVLSRLGCRVSGSDGVWQVAVPALRHDLEREVDLIEEYIRIHGMDKVEPELPAFRPDKNNQPDNRLRNLRLRLSSMGLHEIVTYSFISPRWAGFFGDDMLELKNPISDEMRLMRKSLIPGMVTTVARNRNQQIRNITIFETGRCFEATGDLLPQETDMLGIALCGSLDIPYFDRQARMVDFYDIKGLAEDLLPGMTVEPSHHGFLMAGRQADLIVEGRKVGYLGAVNTAILEQEDIDDDVFVLEFPVREAFRDTYAGFRPLARFPMTARDLSLVVDAGLSYQKVTECIAGLGLKDLRRVAPIDIYEGDKLPAGKKGLTVRITYQSDEQTLSDKQINKWQEKIISALQKDLGIGLRQ